jgi:4-hydroxy-2-oxoheptanedioate aldolase
MSREFADALRARHRLLGYWVVMDSPISTERISRLGYDYVCLDVQHGLIGFAGMVNSLMAVDAGGSSVGLVRVQSNNDSHIGRALDAGATGVIVPLVNSATEAKEAVRSARYPQSGRRSYGPMRSALRIGPIPEDANEATVVLAMIETAEGLTNVDEICAVDGIDGVYVGPSDLCLGIGGAFPGDPAVAGEFETALRSISAAAANAGKAAGIHTPSGDIAARRLAEGFTFASIASDLTHLEATATSHLVQANRAEGNPNP